LHIEFRLVFANSSKKAGLVSGFFLNEVNTTVVFYEIKKIAKKPNVAKKQQMYFFYENNCIIKIMMYNLPYQCKVDTL